jgi:multiple antibiotic resistance protein
MDDTIAAFVRVAMLALAALLPLINPPGVAPIFLSMTPGASEPVRTALARRIARNSFVLLVGAMLVGSYVLIFFGLSLAVVKIAGGLLVIATAWHLVRAEQSPDATIVATSAAPPAAPSAEQIASHSFYPLTFPLTIGPGSISVAVTLGAGVRVRDVADVTGVLGAVAGIVLVSFAIYFCYRFASRILRVLGGTGTVVLLRLSAFILLAVGVQIFCDGLVERFDVLSASSR